jgi:hypothetical protein
MPIVTKEHLPQLNTTAAAIYARLTRCPPKPGPSTLTEPLIAHEPSNAPGSVRELPEMLPSPDKSAMSESLTVGKGRIKFRAFFGRFGLEWEFHKRLRRY